MPGKTIRLFLVDGEAGGLLTAEIMNWTGKAIVCPRPQLASLASRSEARRTGLYALIGPDPENPRRERVYVGESDNVFKRLRQHDQDDSKDFWTRTFLVISKDENLTKSHTLYLESRLIQMAHEAGRAAIANSTEPSRSLPEADTADMEFFLDQVRLVLPVLGFSFTQKLPALPMDEPVETSSDSPTFKIESVGVSARAREIGGEFVVLEGSTARQEGVASWTSYRTLREQLVDEGILVPGESAELLVFAADTPFSSPSAAAAVVQARNANGRLDWKVESTGQPYQEWHAARLQMAGLEGGEDS